MANTPIDSLDFDEIKRNLRDYLRGQDTFQDYDFEGSSLSIILDLLAYNTHYQAFYANMVASEAFLDSARKRNSVISLAKHLGYTPRSLKASRILVNVEYDPTKRDSNYSVAYSQASSRSLYISRGTRFNARTSTGSTASFVTLDDFLIENINGSLIAKDVTLYEGLLRSQTFIYDTRDETQRLIIDDTSIDIDTITLSVSASINDTSGNSESWFRATDITVLNASSNAYFVQANEDGTWEIYFGDGILGRALENGNVIQVFYLSTRGPSMNGIGGDDLPESRSFRVVGEPWYVDVAVVTDNDGNPQPSYGGEDSESTDSIKFYSPKTYQAQERAVTANDYLSILARDYSLRSESFLVWGGEENDPPQYGKVFISIKPKNSAKLSITEKQAISRNILRQRNLMTVTPEVVDPDVTYINFTANVYFDPQKTNASANELARNIRTAVINYGQDNLNKFGSNFRSSKFSTEIDSYDSAINSSDISVILEKRLPLLFNRSLPYTLKYDNALNHPIPGYPSILSSSSFYYLDYTSDAVEKPQVESYLEDDGYGKLRIYKLVNEGKVYTVLNAGTVDYDTGTVVLKAFSPLGIPDGSVELKIRVVPSRDDIFVRRNQVLEINSDSITINAIEEKTVIDRSASDTKFPFRA